jgi:hypothetical protein
VNARGVAVKARIFVSTAHEHTIQKVDDNTPATDHPSDADKVVEDTVTRQAMHAAATWNKEKSTDGAESDSEGGDDSARRPAPTASSVLLCKMCSSFV